MTALLRRTFRLLDARTRRRVVAAGLLSLVTAGLEAMGLGLVLPFVQLVADPGLVRRNETLERVWELAGSPEPERFLMLVGGAVFTLFIARGLASIGILRWHLSFLAREEARLSEQLLAAYLAAPWPRHKQRNSAELVRNIQISVPMLVNGLVQQALILSSELILGLAILALLFLVEPLFALLTGVFLALVGGAYVAVVTPRTRRLGMHSQQAALGAYQDLRQSLEAFKDLRILHRAPHFLGRYRDSRGRWADAKRGAAFLQQLPRYYLETAVVAAVLGLSLVVLGLRTPRTALGVLALFAAAGFRLMPSANRILVALNQMRISRDAAEAVLSDFDEASTMRKESQTTPPTGPAVGELHLRGVSYRYPDGDAPVLRSVDLVVGVGESVGLVGPSGGGKTTLVDLLLGLLEPTAGIVEFRGPEGALPSETWRHAIGHVPQEVYLIDDTLARNIAFGVPDDAIDEERLAGAIRMAQLEDVVAALPDGISTVVGERGVRLSGGQRQRVGIARALYDQPSVLVLDEATSALDSETEARITATIEQLHGRLTLVVVAHRLSTIRSCDRLYFLQNGRIEASGTFEDLRASNAAFAGLVRLGGLDHPSAAGEGPA